MSLAATITTFDLRWWNNWKCLVNSAAPSFLNIRPSDSSLPPLKPFLPLCPFPSGPLASRPAWLPAPADVYRWFIRAQNGWHFPLPAICWHCLSRCLRTSEHLDFLLPLQHFNMGHIISRLLIVQLTFLSFVFLFVMHIFKFWHITHINYWGKKRPPSCLLLWMPGLDCCSCQQGDQRDVWVEEAFCIGCKSPSV